MRIVTIFKNIINKCFDSDNCLIGLLLSLTFLAEYIFLDELTK